jgi:hypothetical protein
MFAVDEILVSDALLDAPFACQLGACHGACCVQGAGGAPLEEDELEVLERALAVVEHELRPEARATIREEGVWTEEAPGQFATTCVDDAECVFVVYEGPVAKCAIQRAYHRGRLDFEKPISCHLFPVRIEQWADTTVLNYERIELCQPAIGHGRRLGVQLADFLRAPLIRRFGAAWFDQFRATCEERAAALTEAMQR